MPKYNWREVSFAEGVRAIDGNKIVEKPKEEVNFPYGLSNKYSSDWLSDTEFFENGIALSAVSNWERGWYHDVNAESPQFFLGVLEKDTQ